MIYRISVGIGLQDAMLWQEQWIHPESYWFRLKRGARDAASLLQVLAELVGVGGMENLAGFGLDYNRCFDLMLQEIVFRLAEAFGMPEMMIRAIWAMYSQLRRAFRFVGCLDEWSRATNGVLQGCPMSAVLKNLLTTVWKRRIDEQQNSITMRVESLPPRLGGLDLVESTGRFVGG